MIEKSFCKAKIFKEKREEKRRETSDKPSVMIVVINVCSNVISISSWWAVGEVKLVR
jgi:hypothetical protein